MKKARVLYVTYQMLPYVPETHLSKVSRYLPQAIQEKGKEVRIFMPRYGCINERRYQLHEVIRLSGMNIVVNDIDHPLIIKVASIQAARMQVYFIDNEEYFQRKNILADDNGKFFADNDERAIFYSRGVLETIKKLGWIPDIIHCHGWMTSFLPLYLKTLYKDDPAYAHTKVVYSYYDDEFKGNLDKKLADKLVFDGLRPKDVELYLEPNFVNICKMGIKMADAVIQGSEKVNAELEKYVKKINSPKLGYKDENEYASAYSALYDEIFLNDQVLAE
jgi:starch synthase